MNFVALMALEEFQIQKHKKLSIFKWLLLIFKRVPVIHFILKLNFSKISCTHLIYIKIFVQK